MLCFASEISHSLYSVSSFNSQLKGHFPREALLILHRLMASLVAQLVKNPPATQETSVQFLVGKIPWRRNRLPTPVFLGFHYGSAGKESACNVRDLSLIPELERSPGEGKSYPLQCSGLGNSMDCIIHGVIKSQTRLSIQIHKWGDLLLMLRETDSFPSGYLSQLVISYPSL